MELERPNEEEHEAEPRESVASPGNGDAAGAPWGPPAALSCEVPYRLLSDTEVVPC
jgi:hypothetical protein